MEEKVCLYWACGKKYSSIVVPFVCDTRILYDFVLIHRGALLSDNIRIQPACEVLKPDGKTRGFRAAVLDYFVILAHPRNTITEKFAFIKRGYKSSILPEIIPPHLIRGDEEMDFEGVERICHWAVNFLNFKHEIEDDPQKCYKDEDDSVEVGAYQDKYPWAVRGYSEQNNSSAKPPPATGKKTKTIPLSLAQIREKLRLQFPFRDDNENWTAATDSHLLEKAGENRKTTLRNQRIRRKNLEVAGGSISLDPKGRVFYKEGISKRIYYYNDTLLPGSASFIAFHNPKK